MDIWDIGVYDQFCYTGKTCKADKRQCLSTYYYVSKFDILSPIGTISDIENLVPFKRVLYDDKTGLK